MKLNKRYRIKRTDPNNLAIQRKTSGGNWVVISYHGNSIQSLVSGLLRVIISNRTPDDVELCEQLEKLQLGMIEGLTELKEMIKEAKLE